MVQCVDLARRVFRRGCRGNRDVDLPFVANSLHRASRVSRDGREKAPRLQCLLVKCKNGPRRFFRSEPNLSRGDLFLLHHRRLYISRACVDRHPYRSHHHPPHRIRIGLVASTNSSAEIEVRPHGEHRGRDDQPVGEGHQSPDVGRPRFLTIHVYFTQSNNDRSNPDCRIMLERVPRRTSG